jgi:hypothetical protein
MTQIKSILGYSLAFFGIFAAMAAFLGMPSWAALLVNGFGLKVSPWYSGGEIARVVDHGTYQTGIYKPVFNALIGQRSVGFVQVDWSKKASVPAKIDEWIDLDGDGNPDLRIEWNTLNDAIALTPATPAIIGLKGNYATSDRYIVRVDLRNEGKHTK